MTTVRDVEKPGKEGAYERELEWTDASGTNLARFAIKMKGKGDERSATLSVLRARDEAVEEARQVA